jgi:hypothetical protein
MNYWIAYLSKTVNYLIAEDIGVAQKGSRGIGGRNRSDPRNRSPVERRHDGEINKGIRQIGQVTRVVKNRGSKK